MKTILMLLAPQQFRDIEYIVPRAFFEAAGLEVVTTSSEFESTGKFGYQVHHDLLLDEAKAGDYDGVFMVGGTGSLNFIENETAKHLVTEFHEAGKPIGAICAACRNFLHWNILDGKKCTGHNWDNTMEDLSAQFGATYTGDPVTVDGNILTAYGPEAAEQAANEFIDMVEKREK